MMSYQSKSSETDAASQSQHDASADYKLPISEQEYVRRVWDYSELGAEASLYPGPNYRRLASYLRSSSPNRDSYPFVQWYPNTTTGPNDRIQASSPSEILRHPVYPSASLKEGQLLFLRGQPSSEWLRLLGGTFRIDPEFFHRHLDFLSTAGRRDHYCLPSLPSSSNYIIQLRYFTICKPETPTISAEDTIMKRVASEKLMEKYTGGLIMSIDNNNGTGNSIVRNFSVFNHDYLVVEQSISLCVTRIQGGWTGIAWIDTGKKLSEGPFGPWTDRLKPIANSHDRRAFLPTIQTRPGAGMKPYLHTVSKDQRPAANLAQSAALLHIEYGKTLDKELMRKDAFYAFQELFSFCAFSQNQLLNMIERDVLHDSGSENPKDLSIDQSNYVYIQEFLERQITHLRENLEAIKSRGGPMWPQPEQYDQNEKCREAARVLEKDYESLVSRATRLSERCKSKIGHLATRALLAESKRAIHQSEEVANLTRLAFFFVPLSFTASFFGMNLDPIVSGSNPLWIWFAVSVPIVSVSILFMKWNLMHVIQKTAEILGVRNRQDEDRVKKL